MNFKVKFYIISILMISIPNIPLFSSATEYDRFVKNMTIIIDDTTNIRSKGEEEEKKEINKIIENMLYALYHKEHQKFKTTHTQFLEKLEAGQSPVFHAKGIAMLIMRNQCTPEILTIILDSDSGTDLIQQTFPIDKSNVISFILTYKRLDLYKTIIWHSKMYPAFIPTKDTLDLKGSETPDRHTTLSKDIFSIIMGHPSLTSSARSQYLETTLLFKNNVSAYLNIWGLQRPLIDVTNFTHLCKSYDEKKTEIDAIMATAANEAPK